MSKSRKQGKKPSLREMISEALRQTERISLKRPELATHTVVIFAIDHAEIFRDWINARAEPENEPLSMTDVLARLDNLHEIVDMAIATMPVPASLLSVMQLPQFNDDPQTGQYL
jgi:hypothetical protein